LEKCGALAGTVVDEANAKEHHRWTGDVVAAEPSSSDDSNKKPESWESLLGRE
jgi:hypothetical protein